MDRKRSTEIIFIIFSGEKIKMQRLPRFILMFCPITSLCKRRSFWYAPIWHSCSTMSVTLPNRKGFTHLKFEKMQNISKKCMWKSQKKSWQNAHQKLNHLESNSQMNFRVRDFREKIQNIHAFLFKCIRRNFHREHSDGTLKKLEAILYNAKCNVPLNSGKWKVLGSNLDISNFLSLLFEEIYLMYI